MGLLDDFRNEPVRTGTYCRIQVIKEQLSDAERDDFDQALADRGITAAAIERVLARKSIRLNQNSITRHRRGECTCDK